MKRVILVLNDYCHINGGASKVAIDEAVSLADAGERVMFLGASGPVCKELRNSRVEVFCLEQPELITATQNPGVLLQGLWNIAAYTRMDALLATLDKDATIVHLHGYTKALTASPIRAAVKRGFKVVCTLHDFFTACPNGAFFDYTKNRICPKRGLSMDCIATHCDKRHYHHKLYRVARSAVQKTLGRLPGGVMDYITLSHRSLELLKPYLPKAARFHPLENLIEVAKLPPADVAANNCVVAVGRLDIEKGIELLLEASRQAGVKLTLVGDGPLRARAESYDNCRVTGWLAPEKVQEELNRARCLAFPSLWYEAYGLVVAEAAARGVPAIVSDISAAAERISDGVEGWHTRSGDMQNLVQCLEFTKNDNIIRAMGLAAYNSFWSAPPTRGNHTAGLLKIYQEILRQPVSS
jgi:glycosyltransferase involved in cell wall biosynthesis